jgi:predicted RNase H-like HicB family nuclease
MLEYAVKCTRTGNWWAISVPDLPGVFSQARRLDQVEATARDAIALFLDVSPKSFGVAIQPEVPGEVTRARRARAKLVEAEQSAERATVEAARALVAKGYTVRDAGKLLGISPQRVSQLTASKTVNTRKVGQRGAKTRPRSGQRIAA